MYISLQTSVYPCSLGHVLVSSMPVLNNKICALELGNNPIALITSYKAQHKTHNTEGVRWESEPHDDILLERVLLAVERGLVHPELDLYESGTKFQRDIWYILKKIPVGTTWSYKQVAQEYGNVDAVRAVANACGSNRLAIVIPCHRVIASNGNLGGYRWGEDIKRKLLDREAKLI